MDGLIDALKRCEDLLQSLDRPIQSWKLLTVHAEKGTVFWIGSSLVTETVLGPPHKATNGVVQTLEDLPVLTELRNMFPAPTGTPAQRTRQEKQRHRAIAIHLAKPGVRQRLTVEIAALEAVQDRSLAWRFAEAAAVISAAIDDAELTFDAGRYYGRALEAAGWFEKLEHPGRTKQIEDRARRPSRSKGGLATKGLHRSHVTLVRLAVSHLVEEKKKVNPIAVLELLSGDVPIEIGNGMNREHDLLLPPCEVLKRDKEGGIVTFFFGETGSRELKLNWKSFKNLVGRWTPTEKKRIN